MRVLHVIPSLAGMVRWTSGGDRAMCRALQAQGIDPLIVTTNEGRPEVATDNTDSTDNSNRLSSCNGVPARFFPVQLGAAYNIRGHLRRGREGTLKTSIWSTFTQFSITPLLRPRARVGVRMCLM